MEIKLLSEFSNLQNIAVSISGIHIAESWAITMEQKSLVKRQILIFSFAVHAKEHSAAVKKKQCF